MIRAESERESDAVAQTQFNLRLISPAVFLAPERQLAKARPGSQYFVPIHRIQYFTHFGGGVAHGVEGADDAAHARSADHVHRYLMLFQPFDYADVRDPARPAAAQDQTDLERSAR